MQGLADLPTISAERVRLERMSLADLDELIRITDAPSVTEWIDLIGPRFTRGKAQQVILGGFPGVDGCLGIKQLETGALMGCVVIAHHGEGEIEIGYWIGVDFRARGFAAEAACALVCFLRDRFPEKSIVAECRPDNTPSWRVLEKLGFHPTGDRGSRPGRHKLIFRPTMLSAQTSGT